MPTKQNFFTIQIWDRTIRIFHWVNVLCVLGLIAIGLVILNSKSFGISSDGKILLKTIHVYIGYVFVFNLLWRILWGFWGSKYARWGAVLPFHKDYLKSLKAYLHSFRKKDMSASYAGHNPMAKLMVFMLLLVLCTQAITGLILAGTDLYMPPFGNKVTEWISEPRNQEDLMTSLMPGSLEGIDQEKYTAMREVRSVIVQTHVMSFYILFLLIILHVTGVVITEIREGNGLISAMITGKKIFKNKPIDEDDIQS
jgi:cytochrome b